MDGLLLIYANTVGWKKSWEDEPFHQEGTYGPSHQMMTTTMMMMMMIINVIIIFIIIGVKVQKWFYSY